MLFYMNVGLGHDSAFIRLYWAGTTWANEMNLIMNNVPGAGSIDRPVDQQSSVNGVLGYNSAL